MTNRESLIDVCGGQCECGEKRKPALIVQSQVNRKDIGVGWEKYYQYLAENHVNEVKIICRNCLEVQKANAPIKPRGMVPTPHEAKREFIVKVDNLNSKIPWMRTGYVFYLGDVYTYPELEKDPEMSVRIKNFEGDVLSL